MKGLILMTRVPIPGKTKTRLMQILSARECAEIHKAFLLDIFNVFNDLKDDIDIYLTYTPEDSFDILKNMVPDYIKCFPQLGEDLGERMLNSIDCLLKKAYTKVVLMGCDVPQIQPEHIREAFKALDKNNLCLGPTFDGGYYLVGMNKLCKEIFNPNLKWGNKSVLEGTLDICNRLDIDVELVKKCRDIDTKEDFIYLTEKIKKEDFQGKVKFTNTMEFIEKYWRNRESVKRYIES